MQDKAFQTLTSGDEAASRDRGTTWGNPQMTAAQFVDSQAEEAVRGWICSNGRQRLKENFSGFSDSWFITTRVIHEAASDIEAKGLAVNNLTLVEHFLAKGTLESEGGNRIAFPGSDCWEVIQYAVGKIRDLYFKRRAAEIFEQGAKGNLTALQAISYLEPLATGPEIETLASRRFNAAVEPQEAVPRLCLAGQGVCTAGNLALVTGAAKTGKSAVVQAILAACLDGSEHLGIHGAGNEQGRAVIHFDTEQSRYDHWQLVRRSMHRARVTTAPVWLRSYSLADVPTEERRHHLHSELRAAQEAHSGVHLVILDGVADLCRDPNDPAEAFGLVEELHRLAIRFDCPIICVLHLNPGSDFKTRGHLGSQLERKVEGTIALEREKNSEVINLWMPPSRHGYLTKDQGPRFAWSDESGRHELIEGRRKEAVAQAKAEQERAELERLAHLVIDTNGPRKWGDFISDLTQICGSKKSAERKFTRMKAISLLSQALTGEWELAA